MMGVAASKGRVPACEGHHDTTTPRRHSRGGSQRRRLDCQVVTYHLEHAATLTTRKENTEDLIEKSTEVGLKGGLTRDVQTPRW